MKRIPIYKNPSYEDEAQRLLADPIIHAMADELHAGLTNSDLEAWAFVRHASYEYHARGGRLDFSIGGPAEAVKRAYAEKHRDA